MPKNKRLPARAETALAQLLAAVGNVVLQKWQREGAARASNKSRGK